MCGFVGAQTADRLQDLVQLGIAFGSQDSGESLDGRLELGL